jgi:acyl carrier protein
MKAEQRTVSTDYFEQRIINGLAEVLNREPSQVAKEARLVEDLNIDSLDTLELIFKLEEEFNIEIPTGDERRFVTVQDVIMYVEQKINEK